MNEQEQLYDDDNVLAIASTPTEWSPDETDTEDLGDEPTLPGEDDYLLEPTRNYYYENQTTCR